MAREADIDPIFVASFRLMKKMLGESFAINGRPLTPFVSQSDKYIRSGIERFKKENNAGPWWALIPGATLWNRTHLNKTAFRNGVWTRTNSDMTIAKIHPRPVDVAFRSVYITPDFDDLLTFVQLWHLNNDGFLIQTKDPKGNLIFDLEVHLEENLSLPLDGEGTQPFDEYYSFESQITLMTYVARRRDHPIADKIRVTYGALRKDETGKVQSEVLAETQFDLSDDDDGST